MINGRTVVVEHFRCYNDAGEGVNLANIVVRDRGDRRAATIVLGVPEAAIKAVSEKLKKEYQAEAIQMTGILA